MPAAHSLAAALRFSRALFRPATTALSQARLNCVRTGNEFERLVARDGERKPQSACSGK